MDLDVDRGSFGTVLRRLRLEAQMSQEQLAERAHLSPEGVSALERGRRRAPYRETIRMLADALGLSEAQRGELAAAAQRPRVAAKNVRYDSAPGDAASGSEAVAGKVGHNLPTYATRLINRSADLAKLHELFAGTRVLTITGTGGIGKTRVALEFARALRAATGNETWFIDLAPLHEAALISPTISSTIGAKPQQGGSATDSIASHIGNTPMLLVIDNCEHLIDEAAAVVETMLRSCANLRVLATSREALRVGGEIIFRLPALRVPPQDYRPETSSIDEFSSVALFVERARAANSELTFASGTLADVGQICRRLDGIPLAIELVSAQTQTVSIPDLRSKLHDRLNTLSGGPRGALPRQQTMSALIDWSYDLLTRAEKTLFPRLAVFAGGWPLEAVQAVCSDETFTADQVLQTLFSLVQKSLVSANVHDTQSRYRLLESTRQYALEKLSESELALYRRRHAVWVSDFASWVYESSWHWSERDLQDIVWAELDNVRAALQAMLAPEGDRRIAARIAASLALFFFQGDLQPEGRRWIETTLEALDSGVDSNVDAAVLGRLWLASAQLGSGKRAVAASEKAIEIFVAQRNAQDLAVAYLYLGWGMYRSGRSPEALAATQRALDSMTACGLERTRRFADALDLRATILFPSNFEAARAAYKESYELRQVLQDEYGMARTQGNLAELEFACNNIALALDLVERAAAIFRRLGAIVQLAIALVNSAGYRLMAGELDEAARNALEVLELAQRAKDRGLLTSYATQQLATVLALRARPKPAAILIGYVDTWYRNEGSQRESNEQRIYDLLRQSLTDQVAAPELAELMRRGSTLSQDEVVNAARAAFTDNAEEPRKV